jgi:predicted nucleic-acid-binding protein
VRITADTNVLVRAAVQDEPGESRAAADLLRRAELVAVPVTALCEFVWVLARGYRRTPSEISTALERLLASGTVTADLPAVEAGLAVLQAGGDFADGVIAFEGRRLGGQVFATFDRKAADRLRAGGAAVHLLSRQGDSRP